MPKTAFISYASEDESVATAISVYLERSRVSCWIAHRDARPGANYATEIIDAIETSAVFVLVLSENSNDSAFVAREVERAVSKGKPIFPVRVREVVPSKSLEFFISNAQWVDAWQPPIEQYLDRLAESIRSAASVYRGEFADDVPVSSASEEPARATSGWRSRLRAAGALRPLHLAGVVALIVLGALLLWNVMSPASDPPTGAAGGANAATTASGGAKARTPASDTARQPSAVSPAGDVAREPEVAAAAASPSDADPCPGRLSINPQLPTPFTCRCDAAAAGAGTVWGTEVYTDDSSLCRAALHAGVIRAAGGSITVNRTEGRPLFVGSVRNGVESADYGFFPRTIEFTGTVRSGGLTLCPRSLSVNRSLPTPFTCRCTAEAANAGTVWGTDVYTDDSALCLAAVHAGVITPSGGTITVTRAQPRALYTGTSRHGVLSADFGAFPSSIRFQ